MTVARSMKTTAMIAAILLIASARYAWNGETSRQGQQSPSPARGAMRRNVELDRPPSRTIRDPNPLFSAVAVEPKSNMLVVTDENLFQVLEYDRRDNTPAASKLTEPKRVISGPLTKAEMMCGVYIDPVSMETYVVNNDTQDWLAIFSKDARGNVEPNRYLAVPQGTFGIAMDEAKQEMYLTVEHNNAVVVYRKGAKEDEPPIRYLAGNNTRLEDPHGVAVDAKRNLLIVSNHGSVSLRDPKTAPAVFPIVRYGPDTPAVPESSWRTLPGGKFNPPSISIYRLDAVGDTPPLAIIAGPKTGLNWPMQVAVDDEKGEVYIANDMDHSVVVFRVTDNGDVAPIRTIKGAKTGLRNPTGVALDFRNREVWAANMGSHSATVYPMASDGNVVPLRTIRGGPSSQGALMIGNPGAVGYDSKRDQILVPN